MEIYIKIFVKVVCSSLSFLFEFFIKYGNKGIEQYSGVIKMQI